MNFARKVWKLLVAIKDGLVLVFMLLFFIVLFGALSSRPNEGGVQDGALFIALNGVIVEEASPIDPLEAFLTDSLPTQEYAARDLVRAIDGASKDERVKMIALDLTSFLGGSQLNVQIVADALGRFRASGKPIYTHAIAYADDHMMLAAHADEIWLDPLGGVTLTGPGGETLFYGDLLDRFNVKANVFRVGTHKSATEPYTESGMSDLARENLSQVYATLWEEWQASVKKARPDVNIDMATGDLAAWLEASDNDLAKASQAAGLVDKIGTYEEWGVHIAEIAGEDEWSELPGTFAMTEYSTWLASLTNDHAGPLGEGDIAVITIAGEISDGDTGPGSAGAARITRLLDEALASEPSALVVRVSSPGGTVTGGEAIRRAIMRHKAKDIPIVVSMGSLAASAGYWIATPADHIFAEPSTITGSIGVFAIVPTFEDALAQYGVNSDGIRTTGLSGQPDLLGGLTPELTLVLQSQVETIYSRFTTLVAESRNMPVARVDEIGQGQIWDGGAARQFGLIDQFGGLEDAIAFAAQKAELEEGSWNAIYLGAGEDAYGSIFEQILAGGAAQMHAQAQTPARDVVGHFAQIERNRLGRIAADLDGILQVKGVQARCLACGEDDAAQSRGQSPSSRSLLAKWMLGLVE